MKTVTFSLFLFQIGCSGIAVKKDLIIERPDGFSVTYDHYLPEDRSKTTKSSRTVIIFPPTGGANFIDRSYAKTFCQAGAASIIIKSWTGQDEKDLNLDLHQRLHERALRALEEILKEIPTANAVSLMGTSVGGLFSAIAASRFDRLDRVLVVGAGAPIPEVIVNSNFSSMKKLKSQRKKKFKYGSDQAYLGELSKKFSIDPMQLSRPAENKKLGMIVLTEDEIVPAKTQLQLKEFWSPDFVLHIDSGHTWGIMYTWLFHTDEIRGFLVPHN